MRHLLRAGGLALLLVLTAVLGTATPAAAQPASEAPAQRIAGGLRPVVDLSAQRVLVGDLVAASKWGTDQPIDDPAREQAVLAAVAELARERGTDPDRVVAIFRDQIEASKIVQRGLFRQWTRHPEQAATERPDLDQVRAEINRLNVGIVDAVADSERARGSLLCGVGVVLAEVRVDHERDLDALHRRALDRSVDSVCG
ncbi:chorismate mutase [Microlunatus sp. GCM10028923]|uniref:chorismate mutase n=1 Tax=Microlunatus sp. GCM10028923 TaxID=3273400 RepID=UPI00361EDAB9